jgi:transcriptional regulator NrdR family protein
MIPCPICGAKTRVTETRVTATSARRRRACRMRDCSGRVTTVEIVVADGQARTIAKGSIVVAVQLIERLREVVAAIGGEAP